VEQTTKPVGSFDSPQVREPGEICCAQTEVVSVDEWVKGSR
jgi:hypothetical protein